MAFNPDFMSRLQHRLSTPISNASLLFFRVVFGVLMLFHVWHEFSSGNIEHVWVMPQIHFTYTGFGWLPHLPGVGYYVLFGILFVCGLLITVGLYFRTAAAVYFVVWSYVFLSAAAAYQNHFYLICLISALLMFMPASHSFSLDVYFGRVNRSRTAPIWSILMLRLQFAILYFFGGLAKINSDWMAGHPVDLWLSRRTDYFLIGPYTSEPWLTDFISWGGLTLDLIAAPLLFWKRTRLAAFLVTAAFHVTNNWLFDIGIFPWFMIFGTLVFFDPDWPLQLAKKFRTSRLGFVLGMGEHKPATKTPGLIHAPIQGPAKPQISQLVQVQPGINELGKEVIPQTISSFGVAIIGLYIVLQVFLPLRHHEYPGNTSWSEEGHFFAWRMMLQDKRVVSQQIEIVSDHSSEPKRVVLRDYFEMWQAENMLQSPDLIRQFANHLKEEEQRRGARNVQVKVDVLISLNGREPQQLIDPTTDLASKDRTIAPADWIVPLTTPQQE